MGWKVRMRDAALLSSLLIAVLGSPGIAQTSPSAPATTTKSAPAPKLGTSGSNSPQTALAPLESQIDLNSAPASELDNLPGIGKARADAIVKNRPYKSADDLVTRHVLPQKVFDGLKDRVMVR